MHNKWLTRRLKTMGNWNQHYQNKFHHRQVSKQTRQSVKADLAEWEYAYGYGREWRDDLPHIEASDNG